MWKFAGADRPGIPDGPLLSDVMAAHSQFDFIDGANLQRPKYLATSSTHTAAAGYSAPDPPPVRQVPSHIVYDPQLLQKMRECLRAYLTTCCGSRPVSDIPVTTLDITQRRLARGLPDLTSETTVFYFFAEALVADFVFDVDGVGINLGGAPTSYGAKPEMTWGGRLHLEFQSPRALLHHAPEIFAIAKANNGKGSALVLRQHEVDARSIIFKIGISMVTNNLTWGILTSGLVSIFFYRHVVPDTNGEPHHILSCSELVYTDATHPSLLSLFAVTLLGSQDPNALVPKPVDVEITLQPYPFPPTASPSNATRSKIGRHRGSRNYPKSTAHLSSAPNPRGSTLPSVRKVGTLEHRVGARRQCPGKCPTLRVQFVESYWPDLVYSVRRVRSDASPFSRHTVRGTTCRFPPSHLKLYERVGRGKFGQVLNGIVSVPRSRVEHNVVAKLFLRAHLDKLHNEIRLYRTRLAGLRNKAIPKVFGAFVMRRGSRATAETMENWGLIVMEKCGSAAQSVDELTVDQREAAYRCLCLIHQAGVEHRDFHLNNILFSSSGVRVIDFSEAIEHDCPGTDCYELCRAREKLKLPPND